MHVGILYPDSPNWPKLRWVHEALVSLGLTVERARNAEEFARMTQECDLVITGHKGIGGSWPNIKHAIRTRKAKVAVWWFDLIDCAPMLPLRDQAYLTPENQLPLLQAVDFVFIKEASRIPDFHALGINAHYLDQGCSIDCREVVRTEIEWDVLVWGQGGRDYPERTRDALGLAQAGFRVAWAAQGYQPPGGIQRLPWCHPDELPELCGKALCVLSADKRHDVPGYVSDRLWMALGMGCCVLRRESPGLPDGPYIRYSHRGELVDKVTFLTSAHSGGTSPTPILASDALGLGREARAWCLENHTLAHRCRQLLETVSAKTAKAAVA